MTWKRSNRPMGRGWPAKRARVLAGSPVCTICKERPATEVDHKVSRAQGGTDAESNLRGVCKRCHGIRTQRQSVAARRPISGIERLRRAAVARDDSGRAALYREIKQRQRTGRSD